VIRSAEHAALTFPAKAVASTLAPFRGLETCVVLRVGTLVATAAGAPTGVVEAGAVTAPTIRPSITIPKCKLLLMRLFIVQIPFMKVCFSNLHARGKRQVLPVHQKTHFNGPAVSQEVWAFSYQPTHPIDLISQSPTI
jgi:hypothetical protein